MCMCELFDVVCTMSINIGGAAACYAIAWPVPIMQNVHTTPGIMWHVLPLTSWV